MKFLPLLLCLLALPVMAEPSATKPADVVPSKAPSTILLPPEVAKEVYAALQGTVQDRCGAQIAAMKSLEMAVQSAIAPKSP